jgi:hypothetical protein
MRNIITGALTIVLLLLITYLSILLIFTEGKNSIEYIVYKHATYSCFCNKLFFNVPYVYKENLIKETIEKTDSFKIICVTDYNDCSENRYLFLVQKKAVPFSLGLALNEKELSAPYEGTLVNLDAFNKFIYLHPEYSITDIQEKYFYFNWFDRGDYRIIKNSHDFECLLKDFPICNRGNYNGSAKLSELLKRFDVLCWGDNEGLIGYNFIFKNRALIEVKPDQLFCIGNEIYPCVSNFKIEY